VEVVFEEKREAVFSSEGKKFNCYRKIPSQGQYLGKCEINQKLLGKGLLEGFFSKHKEKN